MKRQNPVVPAAACLMAALLLWGCPASETSDESGGTGIPDAGDMRLRRPDGGDVSSGASSTASAGQSTSGATSAANPSSRADASSGIASSAAGTSQPAGSSSAGTSSASSASSSAAASASTASSAFSSASSAGGTSGLIYANTTERLLSFHPVTHVVTDLGAFIFQDAAGQVLTGQRMLDLAVGNNGSGYAITYDLSTPAADFFLVTVDFNSRVARRLGTTKFYSSLCAVPAGMAFPEETLFAVDDVPFLDALRPDTGAVRYSFGAWNVNVTSAGDVAAAAGVGVYASVYDSTNGFRLAQVDTYDGSLNVVGPVGFPNITGVAFGGGGLFGFTREGNVLAINMQTGAGTVVATHAAEFVGAAGAP